MKPRKFKLLITIITITSSLVTSITAFASEINYKYIKNNLSQITSKIWFQDSWFGLDTAMLYLINNLV